MPGISGLVFASIFALSASPSVASNAWVARDLHGSVVALIDNQWAELRDGDQVANEVAVRTLQSGQVALTHDNESIQLGRQTIVRLSFDAGGIAIEQFAGSILLTSNGPLPSTLVLPNLTATFSAATLATKVNPSSATLSVTAGQVSVTSRSGRQIIAAGQSTSILSGGVAVPSSQGVGDTSVTAPMSNLETKSDNGVGNGGVPGNGGQNGNANKGGNGKK